MTPEEYQIASLRQQIRINATLMTYRSIISSMFTKIHEFPEHDHSKFEEIFKAFFDHYKVQELGSLEDSHPELAALVDDLDWNSYIPLDIRPIDPS